MQGIVDDVVKRAEEKFGALTEVEREMISESVQARDPERQAQRRLEALGRTAPPADRRVRAQLIRWMLIDSEASAAIDPAGLTLADAFVEGRLDLAGVKLTRNLGLRRCHFDSEFVLVDAELVTLSLEGTHCQRIRGSRVKAKGAVLLREGFTAHGEVEFINSTIGADFDATNGRFLNRGGIALNLSRSTIGGAVLLRRKSNSKSTPYPHVEGKVEMLRVSISSMLDCENGIFDDRWENEGEKTIDPAKAVALNLDEAVIKSSVFFRRGFQAHGMVKLLGAVISGDLDCRSGAIFNPGRGTLCADRSRISGSVLLDRHSETPTPFRTDGTIYFYSAQIGGALQCRGLVFEGESPTGLEMTHGTIGGAFRWTEVTLGTKTSVNLFHAKVGKLDDDSKSWFENDKPEDNRVKLNVEGFAYESLASRPPANKFANRKWLRGRLRWLALQDPERFSLQPYEQLASVLVRLGYDLEAKAVLIAERDMQRKLGRFGFYGNLKKLLYKWTLGYGYEPRRALFLLLILAFIGAGVFGKAYEHGVLKASKKDEELPRFVPLSYSFDVLVPVINLRQKEFWMPNSDSTAGIAVSSYYCFHVLAGWYLTLGGVAAVTGLIRK